MLEVQGPRAEAPGAGRQGMKVRAARHGSGTAPGKGMPGCHMLLSGIPALWGFWAQVSDREMQKVPGTPTGALGRLTLRAR